MGKRQNGSDPILIAGEDENEVEMKLLGTVLESGETRTEAYDASFNALPEAVREGIKDGHIVADIGLVRRKETGMQYIRLQAKTAEGCAILSQGNVEPRFVTRDDKLVDETDGDNVVNHYNYGKDLKVRNLLTQRLAALVEGPDKALDAAAKNLAKALNITVEQARAMVDKLRSEGNAA